MSEPTYDKMLQVVIPIGLLDDIQAVHVPASKDEEPAQVCAHCNAVQIIDEVRRGAGIASEQYERERRAAAFRNHN